MLDPNAKPVGYWKNSSDNGIIRLFIDFAGESVTKKVETLLSGGYVISFYKKRCLIRLKQQPYYFCENIKEQGEHTNEKQKMERV